MQKLLIGLIVTSSLLALEANQQCQNPNYECKNSMGYYQQGQQDSHQNVDPELTKEVRSALKSFFSRKYENVHATVSNGYVTLTGTVETQQDRLDLERKVRSIPGVKDVYNQVVPIQNDYRDNERDRHEQYQYQTSDQTLNKEINDSIRGFFSRRFNYVNVSVMNGYVTLQGTVPTQEDKIELEQKVRKIEGVKGVNNQVMIQGK